MTTPDILTTVGFEKSKVGSGEKERGYQINESSLCSLLGSLLTCFAVMGFMVVFMVFDIHFEKKTLHRQLRVEEHHAVEKLAKVQMELWSQYRDDIQESNEASMLLKHLEASYGEFQGRFKGAVTEFSNELKLNQDKSSKFADKILHLVADMQQDNVKHAKKLLEHLVKEGKKSAVLEKHVSGELLQEVKAESKLVEADEEAGIDVEDHAAGRASGVGNLSNKEKQEDPLKRMLEGFFWTFNDYEHEFGGKPREMLKPGNKQFDQIQTLWTKVLKGNASEEDVGVELDKIDLASIGAPLGSGRVLPVKDIVEEIQMIPDIPLKHLTAIEKEWKSGESDSIDIFEQIKELHVANKVPSGWLQMGVDREEKEEEFEEKEVQEKGAK
jgi:hypothetical protein